MPPRQHAQLEKACPHAARAFDGGANESAAALEGRVNMIRKEFKLLPHEVRPSLAIMMPSVFWSGRA